MQPTIATTRTAAASRGVARWLALSLAAMLVVGGAMQARAQPLDPGVDAGAIDPPGRVARLSESTGQVWLNHADSDEWIAIGRNRPLTSGDRIATDNGVRAEVWLGSTTLRLDGATELEIVELDDSTFHVAVQTGSIEARVRSPQALAEFSITTEEGRVRAQSVGSLRVDRYDGQTDLTVLAGQGVFEGRGSALPMTAGQHARFWLDGSGNAQYSMADPPRDAFTAWVAERDRSEVAPPLAVRHVSPEMTGADDLVRYGSWDSTPEYGAVWYPRSVASDWAPYSAGHWAWVRPWGWTWIDDAPWGFAPFHYGRWVYYRSRWGWAPGTYVARPVYAPALVAWMGGSRAGISLSVGGGSPAVGWFPLAPREVYVPDYRVSPRYVRNVNVTQVTNVTVINNIVNNVGGARDRRDYTNRRYPNAVTVVPAAVLTTRQPVGPAASRYGRDPQVRAFVDGSGRRAVSTIAPVGAPPAEARSGTDRRQAAPPFAGRRDGRDIRQGDVGRDTAGGNRDGRSDPAERGDRGDRRGSGDRGDQGRSSAQPAAPGAPVMAAPPQSGATTREPVRPMQPPPQVQRPPKVPQPQVQTPQVQPSEQGGDRQPQQRRVPQSLPSESEAHRVSPRGRSDAGDSARSRRAGPGREAGDAVESGRRTGRDAGGERRAVTPPSQRQVESDRAARPRPEPTQDGPQSRPERPRQAEPQRPGEPAAARREGERQRQVAPKTPEPADRDDAGARRERREPNERQR